jgi:acylphosphatase
MVNTTIIRLNAIVHGRVQGVSFRAYTVEEAQERELTGWVRNRGDTSVEVLAEGERSALQSLLDWLHVGSPAAHVTRVEFTWHEATGEFSDFRIRY